MVESEYFKAKSYIFKDLYEFNEPTDQGFDKALEKIRAMKIYKFMKFDYVKDMIQNKTLQIGKVNSWDDVYENIFLKQNFYHELNGIKVRVGLDGMINVFFGQSWTTLPESDAMWRIYAPDSKNKEYAVRIRTTIGKLMDAVYDNRVVPETFIGEVKYVDNKEISEILDEYRISGWKLSTSSIKLAELLMLKRIEFNHENEVRIIVVEDTNCEDVYLKFNIDPDDFIEEITLDPRLKSPSNEYNKYKGRLIGMGVLSSKINRSKLYDLPNPVDIDIL